MTQNAKNFGNFTMVQNDFIMAACQCCHGRDLAVVMAIYRFTWGFQKESAPLSLKTLAKYTKLDKGNISKVLQDLIERNIVKVYQEADKRKSRHIGINDIKEWATGAILTIDQEAKNEVEEGREAPQSMLPAPVKKEKARPTKEDCIQMALFFNKPEKFGELFWLKMEGQGWTNGNGHPIASWKAYMERYALNDEMYNQLMGIGNGKGQSANAGTGYRRRDEGIDTEKYNALYEYSQKGHR